MATKKRRKVSRKKKKKNSAAGWRRSPVTGGVAVLIILVCLYTTFFSSPGMGKFKADYVCTSCREVFRETMIQEAEPHECFNCGENAMWMAYKCMDCSKISANLPPLADYTCAECDFHGEAKHAGSPPHNCSKCSKEALWETYYCEDCDKNFPAIDMMTMCPDCQYDGTYPTLEQFQTCEHCDSENLDSVTPYAVIRWELGKSLTPEQEAEVDAWKAKQD